MIKTSVVFLAAGLLGKAAEAAVRNSTKLLNPILRQAGRTHRGKTLRAFNRNIHNGVKKENSTLLPTAVVVGGIGFGVAGAMYNELADKTEIAPGTTEIDEVDPNHKVNENNTMDKSLDNLIATGQAKTMFKDIEFASIDLDGTLVQDDHKANLETLHALKNFESAGKTVIINTGRTFYASQHMVDSTKEHFDLSTRPGVYSEGLAVFGENGKLVYESNIDIGILLSTLDYALSKNMVPIFSTNDSLFILPQHADHPLALHYQKVGGEPIPKLLSRDWRKQLQSMRVVVAILVVQPDQFKQELVELKRDLSAIVGEDMVVATEAYNNLAFIECFNKEDDKAEGLKKLYASMPNNNEANGELSDHVDEMMKATVAIGDGGNDIEQISQCGVGVAMGQDRCNLKLRECAQVITKPNYENGVVAVLHAILETQKEE